MQKSAFLFGQGGQKTGVKQKATARANGYFVFQQTPHAKRSKMMTPTYSTTAELLSMYRNNAEARCALPDQTKAICPQYKTTTQMLAMFPRQVAPYSADRYDS